MGSFSLETPEPLERKGSLANVILNSLATQADHLTILSSNRANRFFRLSGWKTVAAKIFMSDIYAFCKLEYISYQVFNSWGFEYPLLTYAVG